MYNSLQPLLPLVITFVSLRSYSQQIF